MNSSLYELNEIKSFFSIEEKMREEERKNNEETKKKIKSLIRFEAKNCVKEYDVPSDVIQGKQNNIIIISKPINIEELSKEFSDNYYVLYDPDSKNFYEIKYNHCYILLEYIILLPKVSVTLHPYVIIVSRVIDEIIYKELLTGVFCEDVRRYCIEEILNAEDLKNYSPDFYEFEPEIVHHEDDYIEKYVKEKFLNNKVVVMGGSENRIFAVDKTGHSELNYLSKKFANELLKKFDEYEDKKNYYDSLRIGDVAIKINADKVIKSIRCRVNNLSNGRLIGSVKLDKKCISVEITYDLDGEVIVDKYIIMPATFKMEGFISDFVESNT